MPGLDEPTKYTLSEGITLDKDVFGAFSKEFDVKEFQRSDDPAFLVLSGQQLHEFHQFHTAYRYAKEIRRLEGKIQKEKDPTKKSKIQKNIDQRKSSREYKKYGEMVERYVQQ